MWVLDQPFLFLYKASCLNPKQKGTNSCTQTAIPFRQRAESTKGKTEQ
jgi:hypothetical protein